MTTNVQIVNSALVTLGETVINSLEENTDRATIANVKWDICRQSLLRLHPWRFAITRAELAQDNSTPAYQFDYQYTLPSDCLRLYQVYKDVNFRLENRKILTDKDTCYIKYIADVEDTSKWDPLFVDLMASKLALELAYTIPRARTMIDSMAALYEMKLVAAKAANNSEDIFDDFGQGDDTLNTIRYQR